MTARRTDSGAPQRTLAQAVEMQGPGIHTGQHCRVELRPAGENAGITFSAGACRIPARAEFVTAARRCTRLGRKGGSAQIDTVEHLLSALAGMQVTNVEAVVDGPELPILDGSALPWVEAVRSAGIVEQPDSQAILEIDSPIGIRSGDSWIWACPGDEASFTVATHFEHPLLGTEVVQYRPGPNDYAESVAPARTFGFIEEVEALLAAGLARGGSLDNALIVYPDRFSTPLRMPQECTRHKLLDLIGDLALSGAPIRAHITAVRPSHELNTRFAAVLASMCNFE